MPNNFKFLKWLAAEQLNITPRIIDTLANNKKDLTGRHLSYKYTSNLRK